MSSRSGRAQIAEQTLRILETGKYMHSEVGVTDLSSIAAVDIRNRKNEK